jgi:hypothetical protein
VTVDWNPYGAPMAMAICPTRNFWESPSSAAWRCGSSKCGSSIRMTARSFAGSSPISDARIRRPSVVVIAMRDASCTTWLFVRISPSGVKINPEPPPCCSRRSPDRDRPGVLSGKDWCTSMCTTDGRIRSTAELTDCEYASSREASRLSVSGVSRAGDVRPTSALSTPGVPMFFLNSRFILLIDDNRSRLDSEQGAEAMKPAIDGRLLKGKCETQGSFLKPAVREDKARWPSSARNSFPRNNS